MDSADELAGPTPPVKRRKTRDDSSQRSSSSDSGPRETRDPSLSRYDVTRSPSAAASNKDYSSRSPSRRRSRSSSSSGSSSRSESPPEPRTRHRRSESPTSSDRTRTESYSPLPRRTTPPREPFKPNYKLRLALHGHTGPISQVRISPNGKFIASASADGTLKLWDAATGAHIDTLVGHMAGVSCLAWTPDSNTLASGSDDKVIRLWDRVTGRPKTTTRKSVAGQELAALRGHHNYIHCLAFSPKGNILASGSYDEAVFLWDVRAGRLMRSLPAHSDPVAGVDFCRDGTLVVSCSTDGLIRVWDTSTGQCLRTLVHEDNPAVTNVCFSPNGRFVLAFNLDNCIRLWDYVAGTVKKTYQGHRNEKFAIGGCFGVLDGEPFIASASEDGDIVLWDVKNKEILQRVPTDHKGICFWVDVNGETMTSAGQDNTVRVYRHVGDEAISNERLSSEQEVEAQLRRELPIRQEDMKLEDA
ncbi:WD domain protein [Conoideocrella luteorostrata]|uniref:Mitochondrial division protein 1 n=1 Tax=Conoideocrella luteorostrata TaxID=1105319 RepID=A0AAJ0CT93_9HYPO|nr:WD domain protein [Conoideocrella luteorostrata]